MRRSSVGLVLIVGMMGANVLAADQVVDRTLDLRTATDARGTHDVIFVARMSKEGGGGVGHAYVIWATESEARRLSSARAFGFYPQAGKALKAAFTDVPSLLVDEGLKPANPALMTHRLTVRVDRDRWLKSQDQVKQWRTTDYNLFRNNCTHFANAVAIDLGLIVDRPQAELPSNYLIRLIEAARPGR